MDRCGHTATARRSALWRFSDPVALHRRFATPQVTHSALRDLVRNAEVA